jgi:DeoR family transcriptional regulator of aga operon
MAERDTLRLLVEERRRRILELLDTQERATVEELSSRFGVSAVTIRGDLDTLAGAGSLVRSHGGALRRLAGDVPIAVKETLYHGQKVRIGRAATQLIGDAETIILESLTVITNALNIAMELASLPQIRVIVIGGILRQPSYSTVGPHAEHVLRSFTADRLFLGVDGLDPDIGLMTPDVLEAQLNALMIRVSRDVTVVADSSKFTRRSASVIGAVSAVHRIITDDRADPKLVAALRARNIDVMLV